MEELTTCVGLDVHQASIAVAVATERGEPFHWGTIRNRPEAIAALVQKLGTAGTKYVYEAGPTGYALYRQLRALGADCVVAAPSKIERAPGQRVKTDRIDAQKLARQLRHGTIPAVWVPDPEDEALRDLTRARQAAQQDAQRTKQRVGKLLLRQQDLRPPEGATAWSKAYRTWLQELRLPFPSQQVVLEEELRAIAEAEARVARLTTQLHAIVKTATRAPAIQSLLALRGVGLITASTLVAELGDITRFRSPRQLMSYAGLTPTEDSSGPRVRRGAISHVGNAHVRYVLGEMAWHYVRPLTVGKKLRAQRAGQPPAIRELAERADTRLQRRYRRLVQHGKSGPQAATAVAREALGFIWAVVRIAQGEAVPPPRAHRAPAA